MSVIELDSIASAISITTATRSLEGSLSTPWSVRRELMRDRAFDGFLEKFGRIL